MSETQPEGRTMQELRAIVAAENKRWYELGTYWDDLTEDEQVQVVKFARRLAKFPR